MEKEPDSSRPTGSEEQGEFNLNGPNGGIKKQNGGNDKIPRRTEPESSVFEQTGNDDKPEQENGADNENLTSQAGSDANQSSREDKITDSPYSSGSPYLSPEQTVDSIDASAQTTEHTVESQHEEYVYNPYSGNSDYGGGKPPSDNSDEDSDGDEEEEGGPVKPFLEHLEDLRWTLIKSVVAVILGMLVCLIAGRYLVLVLLWPLQTAEKYFTASKNEVAVMLGTNVVARGNPDELGLKQIFGTNSPTVFHIVPVKVDTNTILALQPSFNEKAPRNPMVVIKNYSPIEGIMVALKLALFGGIIVSFPFVMYFIGQFVLPALKVHEKKILFKAVGFSGGLFLLGVVFCYFILLVFALGATVQFSQWLGFSADEWRADAYLSFVVKFMLGMGLAFQLPVIILLLVKIGILDYEKLKKFRSYAFVANLTISAVITPSGDPFTMLLMALPLHLLYEISTFVAWYWHRKELKKAKEQSS